MAFDGELTSRARLASHDVRQLVGAPFHGISEILNEAEPFL
jgi:hypothetical protein